MLIGLFERIEIADRAAALDAARRGDRAGLRQQRLDETRLPRASVAHPRYGTNVFRREFGHRRLLVWNGGNVPPMSGAVSPASPARPCAFRVCPTRLRGRAR